VRGKASIFVVVDQLIKYGHCIPMDIVTIASKVSKWFMQHVYRLHGLPKDIVSDRDPKFIN
jgi:hypothetical protein